MLLRDFLLHKKRCVVAQSSWSVLEAQTQARTKGDLRAASTQCFSWHLYQEGQACARKKSKDKNDDVKGCKRKRIVVFKEALCAASIGSQGSLPCFRSF